MPLRTHIWCQEKKIALIKQVLVVMQFTLPHYFRVGAVYLSKDHGHKNTPLIGVNRAREKWEKGLIDLKSTFPIEASIRFLRHEYGVEHPREL